MKLGLLEFGDITSEYDYQGLIKYVIHADTLGFSRIWFGEHYNNNVSFTNPEALLPIVASLTQQIRIGVGGVLLRYHSPYRIAGFYKLLSNLFFDRIDLGLCRTYMPDDIASLLSGKEDPNTITFDEQLRQLLAILNEQLQPPTNDYPTVPPPIFSHALPSLWILTSAFEDMNKYPNQHLNFCRSLFHNSTQLRTKEIELLQDFNSVEKTVAIALYCSESKEKNKAFEYALNQKSNVISKSVLCYTPEELKEYIIELQEKTHLEEVIVLNMGRDYTEKMLILDLIRNYF